MSNFSKKINTNWKPVVGITMGDYNGIGPEIILKTLEDSRILQLCTPVIYASMKVLSRYRRLLNLPEWFIHQVKSIDEITHKKVNLVNCFSLQEEVEPGKVTPAAGEAAFLCLEQATKDLLRERLDAVVTCPINKKNIQNEHFQYPGHTEYFADNTGQSDYLMFMIHERIKVAVATGHVPIKEVASVLNEEKLRTKLQLMIESLRKDFAVLKPRIAVLGLNPHAGDEGLIGDEEIRIIRPVIKDFKRQGHLVFGPYPADGFFAQHHYTKFDAVLAMYHDQGLIPFKSIAGFEGVNFTAGLPVVRTSPDHGTAYEIAGKGIADPTSLLHALFWACDIAKIRRFEHLIEISD